MLRALSMFEAKVLRLITTGQHSCGSLAKQLKVSRATASNVISSLRKKGFEISTRRDGHGWFYELTTKPDPTLANFVGGAGQGQADYSATVDEDMVSHLEAESRKEHAVVE